MSAPATPIGSSGRRAEQEAPWTDLPGVEIVTRTATTQDGKQGWLIVPRDAARRIKGDG